MWSSLKSIFTGKKYSHGYYAKQIANYANSYLRSRGEYYIYFFYRNNELSCYNFLTQPSYSYDFDGEYTMKIFSMEFSADGNHRMASVLKNTGQRYPKTINEMIDYREFQEQFFLYNYENEREVVFFNFDLIRKIFVNHEKNGSYKKLDFDDFDNLLKGIVEVKPSYVLLHPSNKGLYFHMFSDWYKIGFDSSTWRTAQRYIRNNYGRHLNEFSEKISKRPEVEDLNAPKKEVIKGDIIIEELTEQLNKNVSEEVRKKIQKTLDDYIFETQEKKRLNEIAKNDESAMIVVNTVRNRYLEKKEDDAHG